MGDPKPGTMRYASLRGVVDILLAVCAEFHITESELFDDWGSRSSGKAKQRAAFEIRARGLSWPEVGKVLGVHHTTALRAAKRWEKGRA